ncbi:hypothetical protein J2S10_004390 [Neobacillus ginsengisoli]|uniref:MFS transporter n=1 Tax=Neobacillus ginsengisoli TaxID=904295 RepID=A0ABT9Y023_9BACI|nr:hypothetical protein [Neobacillus ginsengisoli]
MIRLVEPANQGRNKGMFAAAWAYYLGVNVTAFGVIM